jgi:riboflavin kinase/FMN adenylyltransferase
MRVFRGTAHYPYGPCNLTIGNFDGVHLGHAALISTLKKVAEQNHLPTAVLTFEPHPREYFAPHNAPPRLSTLREKLEQFQKLGVDYVFVLPFNHAIAHLSAHAFLDTLLVRNLHIHTLLVGDDFHFGYQRQGNLAMLQSAAIRYGFQVINVPTLTHATHRISSSAIRKALQQGELSQAQALLGRPYSMSGKVMHGDKLGRILGYPTANIHLKHTPPPLQGIFCVEIHGLDKVYQGAASLGVRPTVKSGSPFVLEVFIFDFDRQIYQCHIRIDFLKKLRDEIKFPDITQLTEQMRCDIEQTKAFFLSHCLQ